MFLLICFVYMMIIKTPNRRQKKHTKPDHKVTKLKSNFYLFLGWLNAFRLA